MGAPPEDELDYRVADLSLLYGSVTVETLKLRPRLAESSRSERLSCGPGGGGFPELEVRVPMVGNSS